MTRSESLGARADEVKSTIKLPVKKVLCGAVAVSHVKVTGDELVFNIHLAVNFWCHCSKGTGRMSGLYTSGAPWESPRPALRRSLINQTATKEKIDGEMCLTDF